MLPLHPDADEVLPVALAKHNSTFRGEALAELAARLKSKQAIDSALDGARLVGDPKLRARALRALGARLEGRPDAATVVLGEAFRAALEVKEAAWLDHETVACVESLLEAGPATVRGACVNFVTATAQFGRAHVLGKICCTAPLLTAGFSKASLRDSFDAIDDVGRFWP